MEIIVNNNDKLRIDKYLSLECDYSRNKIQKLIKDGKVLVNNKIVTSNYKVNIGDKIIILDDFKSFEIDIKPSNIEVSVVYEDDDLLVINKESGMVTHPAPGNYEDTLVNALMGRFNLSHDEIRPGIVHRLDKDTSGLMLVAKNDFTHDKLSKMIQDKVVERYYLALVEGTFNHETGTIDAPIGRDPKFREKMTVTDINSKNAITHFKVLERYKNYTLIECKLETGRTHQIRVHMKYINHPVVNDPLYGKLVSDNTFGQLLHSYKIKFPHPRTGEILEFSVEPPKEFQELKEFVLDN
ncbi:MAG: RluA family pseudouridine synthase [Bacilli bacterium]|nr:RluA family pseudouridine synthase [Bacilli bacterium]